MPCAGRAFFSLTVGVKLVRRGADAYLPDAIDPETKALVPRHTMGPVYGEIARQVCMDYPGLPLLELTLTQLRWFYDGSRPALRAHTKSS